MCSLAIFLADGERVQDSCDIIVTPWSDQDAVYLGHRRWGLSAINTTRLTFTCPKAASGPKSYIVDTPAISVFKFQCHAQPCQMTGYSKPVSRKTYTADGSQGTHRSCPSWNPYSHRFALISTMALTLTDKCSANPQGAPHPLSAPSAFK
jgi:hypothetical protein